MMKILALRSVSNRYRHCRRLQKLFIASSNVISQGELESLSICIFFFNIAKSHSLRHCENAKALMSPPEIVNSTYFHGWPIFVLPALRFVPFVLLFSSSFELLPNWVSESDEKKFYLFLKQRSWRNNVSLKVSGLNLINLHVSNIMLSVQSYIGYICQYFPNCIFLYLFRI